MSIKLPQNLLSRCHACRVRLEGNESEKKLTGMDMHVAPFRNSVMLELEMLSIACLLRYHAI